MADKKSPRRTADRPIVPVHRNEPQGKLPDSRAPEKLEVEKAARQTFDSKLPRGRTIAPLHPTTVKTHRGNR